MTLAKRTLLNTQKHHQTAGRERGANRSAVSKLTVATTCPVARAPKDCVPTITPSPTKVIPLRSCNTAPIIEGTTAARCTSTNGEKTLSNGSANSCAHPRAAPKMRPQVIRREAAARALATPPPLRFSSAGIMMDATVERAKSTTPPSCHSWAVMACAAAAVPVWSRLCTVLVIPMKARLSAIERICTAPPAAARRASDAREGTLQMVCQRTRRRFRRNVR
mmetsp:Transcript_21290/g.64890  ORF Transcript_21290/g.64890 Transcript_21290/m.64890 type:complete len:221 (-) Transcript_21290:6-668(-)